MLIHWGIVIGETSWVVDVVSTENGRLRLIHCSSEVGTRSNIALRKDQFSYLKCPLGKCHKGALSGMPKNHENFLRDFRQW